MPQAIQLKKFKKNVEAYMKGKWFKQWEGIKNRDDARQILELTANTRNKKDFDKFPGLDLEPIQGTKNHYSIKINYHWRIFFIWEDNQAWEIEISKHDYKKVKK